jgi:V/A-type H+-transporting ATPase subunit E
METTANQQLESLLERIRREGVDKATREAEEILAAARKKADAMLKEAEAAAASIKARADSEAALVTDRGKQALEHAARDVLLSVQSSLGETLRALVVRDVTEAMSPDVLRKLIDKVVESYVAAGDNSARVDVLVNPAVQKEIAAHFIGRFASEAKHGIAVHGDQGVGAGFRVQVSGENVQHDFTGKAIADAICQFVRPQLAAIVKKALPAE